MSWTALNGDRSPPKFDRDPPDNAVPENRLPIFCLFPDQAGDGTLQGRSPDRLSS